MDNIAAECKFYLNTEKQVATLYRYVMNNIELFTSSKANNDFYLLTRSHAIAYGLTIPFDDPVPPIFFHSGIDKRRQD